ncbi:MAG: hypothetical protein IPQ17_06600 [Xanthomonadales bacterium]|nr:hypothetical protein [Xanthomonadales bacterium]
MNRSANESLAAIAARCRRELARAWLSASDVASLLKTQHDISQVRILRRLARLFGVWEAEERAYRYPPWQFGLDCKPVEQLPEILGLLREEGRMAVGDRSGSGWSEAEWLLSPHALLEGRSPYEFLSIDPDRILKIATEQFVADSDAGGF